MNFLDRLVARYQRNLTATQIEYRASAGGLIPDWQAGRPTWLPQTIETHDQHAYRRVALIFACVRYLAHAAGTAPLRVYNPENKEPDDSHPLRMLLTSPNPGMGESRFISFVVMNMAITNFTVIEIERSRDGTPLALWPLRSDWIRPILRNQAPPDWEYRVPGREPILLKFGDVIPVTWADTPDQSPTGIGPMVAALRETQISSSLTDFLKVFLDRGAVPLYALIPQDEGPASKQWQNPETRNAFLAAWRQRYQGLGNAAEPLPLLGVKDVKRIGLDFNELAYPDLNNRADVQICLSFGIDPVLLGTEAGLASATFSNKAEAKRSFYEDTMPAIWSRIDDAFTRRLLPEFEWRPGWDIHFDTTEIPALQDDRNEANQRAVSAFVAGMVSRHIAQIEAGYDPHGPDEFLIPFSVTPLANTQAAQRAKLTGEVRALPVLDDGLSEPISAGEVDDALDQFDKDFPELAGLLDAEVQE